MTLAKPHNLPRLPGVYLFKDKTGTVLYVGKAKSLASRVASYFTQSLAHADMHRQQKIKELLTDATNLEHIVTRSEEDAILLEEHLIKTHQPPYNISLKEGDPFLYLHITTDEPPTLQITRTRELPGTYFGPFTNRRTVRRSYEYLIKALQLYRCATNMPHGCLKYHLGICAGNCVGTFDHTAYRTRIELARTILAGDTHAFLETIDNALKNAHASLQFEYARQLHQYHEHLHELFATIAQAFSVDRYYREIAHSTIAPSTTLPDHALYAGAHSALQELIGTSAPLLTIDCFDISHMQGRHIVGSSVRFTRGIPDTQQFRRFKIRSLTTQNDYAALQEIVQRRYRNSKSLPDIVLIDGGKGQLSAIQTALASTALPRERIISLAKREERVFTSCNPEGIILDQASPLGKLLISLRDYAHRFALQYHTLLNKKEIR